MATKLSRHLPIVSAQSEQRKAPRHRVLIGRTKVTRAKANSLEAELYDVSIYGCRIACALPQKPGERLWVRLISTEQPVAATIAWNDGDYVGCRFEDAIDSKTLRLITLGIAETNAATSDN